MKMGKKLLALLLVLTVVVGCGVLMASAQTGPGYGEATKSASSLSCVCRISSCTHVPRDNTLGVYIRFQYNSGGVKQTDESRANNTGGQSRSISTTSSMPYIYTQGNFYARCNTCKPAGYYFVVN